MLSARSCSTGPTRSTPSTATCTSALALVWRQLATDPEARVVVLTGAGRAFSAGGDLDWIASFADDHAARDESLREGAEIIDELIRFPLPIVTAVNGPAVGLGFSIALLTDVVLIADDAYLADPHVPVGLVAGDGGAAFWPLLGPSLRLREFLYTGARIEPHLAVELGLATRVVAADELHGRGPARRRPHRPPAGRRGAGHEAGPQPPPRPGARWGRAGRLRRRAGLDADRRPPASASGRCGRGPSDRWPRPRPSLDDFRASVRDWCREHVPRDGARPRPASATTSSSPSSRSGSPSCAAPVGRCRTGRPSGEAA